MRPLLLGALCSAGALLAFGGSEGCGARTGLGLPAARGTGSGGGLGLGGFGGEGGFAGQGGQGGRCPGQGKPCDTGKRGACKQGLVDCDRNTAPYCRQTVYPKPEICDGLDDDCNGVVDDGDPGGGTACNTGKPGVCGPGTTHCINGALQCVENQPPGPEKCDGIDNDCNGIVDSDCTVGNCPLQLLVTGSTPSNPNCIDFPIEKGSTGTIDYPCAGGAVSAVLGGVTMTGTVDKAVVHLHGTNGNIGPDGCQWQFDHYIDGDVNSGTLTYSYKEHVVSGTNCWFPCTETGTVKLTWPS